MNSEDEEFNRIERESKLRMEAVYQEVQKRNKAMDREYVRPWVGLTEKDICEAAVKSQEGISPRDDTLRFAIAIEAKLKEKNT